MSGPAFVRPQTPKPLANLVGKTMPIGLRLSETERNVLNSLSQVKRLQASRIGELVGTTEPIAWMDALCAKLSAAGLDLVTRSDESGGEPAYVLREDLDGLLAARANHSVRLLPVYDQWVMGPGTADPRVTPAARRALVTSGSNISILGGVVAGIWTLKGDLLKVEWFDRKKAPSPAAVGPEVERIGRILGRKIRAGD